MHVVDSHTGGMPTRVILDGGPDLGSGSLDERAQSLWREHRDFCAGVLKEPRGKPGMVAALLVPPDDPDCSTGVIYFDASAVLGMCGHGTIGLGVTLVHLGRAQPGPLRVDTPVGPVDMNILDAETVQVTNVESRCVRHSVAIETANHGSFTGDLAFGGNWFFIVEPSPLPVGPKNIPQLTNIAIDLMESCIRNGLTGERGENVDHVIFQDASSKPDVHSRNFVLCPDYEYDRSPCGTGSSARLACLAARGQLGPGEEIIQESVIGSAYRLQYRTGSNGGVVPTITGQAHVMAEGRLLFHAGDPYNAGIV